MTDYLKYMQQISSVESSRAKAEYLKHNFAEFLKPAACILEIGPGLGEFLEFTTQYSPAAIDVIDRDPATLDSLRSRFNLRSSLQLSAEDIPTNHEKLAKYDLIFMLQIMEHVQTSALTALIKTLYLALNPGGHLVITVPNGANPLGIVERYSDITHVNLFSPNSLLQLVRFAGIEEAEVKVQGYRIPPINFVNKVRILAQNLLHLVFKGLLIVNGGVYFSPFHPNITLVLKKKS